MASSKEWLRQSIFTAGKRSLGQGYIFTGICHSLIRGVCLSACWDTLPAKETPPSSKEPPLLQGDPPRRLPSKETPQGDPSSKRPLSRKTPKETPLQGDPPRPTPKGEIERDQIQAHTQGENWGGSNPGPHPRGNWGGSDPDPPNDDYCWGRYASYWNAFLLEDIFKDFN